MDVQINIPLKNHTTMRLGGDAKFFVEATTAAELMELFRNAKKLRQKAMVLGGGSNLIVRDEGFQGIVMHNAIPGFDVVTEDEDTVIFSVGAGEIWDDVVSRTVERGLTGIECLSAIPGTAGAAPVQNIGAYGQEVADVIQSVEVYDIEEDALKLLEASDCGFGYRTSIFRDSEAGRYAITRMTIKLYKNQLQPPFYESLRKYLDDNAITDYSPQSLRKAVQVIRADKLPDPTKLPNAGSFFKNALVGAWQYNELIQEYPDMPAYKMSDEQYKIPTGWLIEQAGFKGKLLHGMRVHTGNALVLINESASNYSDLAAARQEIIDGVRDTFKIIIEQEPLEI